VHFCRYNQEELRVFSRMRMRVVGGGIWIFRHILYRGVLYKKNKLLFFISFLFFFKKKMIFLGVNKKVMSRDRNTRSRSWKWQD